MKSFCELLKETIEPRVRKKVKKDLCEVHKITDFKANLLQVPCHLYIGNLHLPSSRSSGPPNWSGVGSPMGGAMGSPIGFSLAEGGGYGGLDQLTNWPPLLAGSGGCVGLDEPTNRPPLWTGGGG